MNRIYQGRVSKVQIMEADGSWKDRSIGEPSTCPLWSHHRIFQDAVNYYLIALGALAGTDEKSENRIIRDLRERLEESWERFPRNTGRSARSLRDSLRPWLWLGENASLTEALEKIVDGNDSLPKSRSLALALLLDRCGGEGAIQQGGRTYFPRFCDAKTRPTYDFSPESRAADHGKDALAAVLHGTPNETDLKSIAAKMDLSWTVKIEPGKFWEGDEAQSRLRESLNHLEKMITQPSPRLKEWLKAVDAPMEQIKSLRARIDDLPKGLRIPRNRKAAHDLTFASIAFMAFPCELTRLCLRHGIKEPKKSEKRNKPLSKIDFGQLGDDPIKLARGSRGYVFRAFTALPSWNPDSPGEPAWKEFDIAAFKEALKVLNQFNQKTAEREEKRQRLEAQRDQMLGQGLSQSIKVSMGTDDEESERLSVIGGDPRFELVKRLEQDMTARLTLNVSDPFKISRASLRGFRDLAEKWRQRAEKDPSVSANELQKIVTDYQADPQNQREIGSVPLMLALCENEYRDLWIKASEEIAAQREKENRPVDMLIAMVRFHQINGDLKRAGQPIRLTPAEPEHSRRLFMFSDLSGISKVNFITKDIVEISIAMEDGGMVHETRGKLHFGAPRLNRDELTGGSESRWLQPMTAALGISEVPSKHRFDSAVALMADILPDGTIRHLLNFPVNLDPDYIHRALGKSSIWKNQFNGTKDKRLHLHWPDTAKDATKKNPWWDEPAVIERGFTLLASDLGQRSAGAWALLKVSCQKPETTRPVRSIGHDGKREWFTEILQTGMYRLPGEDAKALMKGSFQQEKSGKRGRLSSEEEYQDAIRIAIALGTPNPESWIDRTQSFPEQNDRLIKLANRRLSRLGTYHRWSCFNPDRDDLRGRRAKIVESLEKELSVFEDPEVKPWLDMVKTSDFAAFRKVAGRAFTKLRNALEGTLVGLANRTVPLRGKTWIWQPCPNGVYGSLVRGDSTGFTPKIRGQRGLSMPRLEQLEGLRRIFLRYNRSLDREPGIPSAFGSEDRGRKSGEPCLDLLEKIDRMKEQRVNQTAHMILAQALGVRLRPHEIVATERIERDLHGEYEKITGREPVDFIVIEDLSRYLSSQGRSPSENSRLMKWAHRAIRDKLKMLAEEPFGIQVVEVTPAYSSRFHARNGQPGSRLHELHELKHYHVQALERLSERNERSERHRAGTASELLQQFKALDKINQKRLEEKKPLHTLYLPKPGGPLFLAARDGNPVQADTNAAINLGLRTIAAPQCIDIHRRVRGTKEKGTYRPRVDNAREKAAFSKVVIELQGNASKKLEESSSPNFFFEPDGLKQPSGDELFDRANLNGHPLVSGVALWSMVNNAVYLRCAELNRQRLAKWSVEDNIPF